MPQTIVDLSQSDRRVTPTLAHDLILGDPTRPVSERAGVTSVQALKNIIGGFTPTSLGSATVSAQVATWRATNLVIPVSGQWFLVRVDLPAHRGLYLLHGAQWRSLSVAAAGGTPDQVESLPFAGGVFGGRADDDTLLIYYAQAQSGVASYAVEVFEL